jgi:hypothetical protein
LWLLTCGLYPSTSTLPGSPSRKAPPLAIVNFVLFAIPPVSRRAGWAQGHPCRPVDHDGLHLLHVLPFRRHALADRLPVLGGTRVRFAADVCRVG